MYLGDLVIGTQFVNLLRQLVPTDRDGNRQHGHAATARDSCNFNISTYDT